ncbi:acyltransferase family protein [Sphingomonas sp. NCPPB 2930]
MQTPHPLPASAASAPAAQSAEPTGLAAGPHGKIVFADQLRSLAAVAVIVYHLFGGFWAWRETVGRFVAAPPMEPVPTHLPALVDLFAFGPFGVSIFFLVSGFVIPMSLERLRPGPFLAARVLRIYPTYLACLAIGLAAVWASSHYWGQPFAPGRGAVAANALLVHTVTGVPTLDPVNWTLAIELKFYLAMALLAACTPRGRAWPLLLAGVAVLGLNLAAPRIGMAGGIDWRALAAELCFVPYMMVGTLFYYHLRGWIAGRTLVAAGAGLLALVLLAWARSAKAEQVPMVSDVYVLNVAVFATAYAYRAHFRPHPLIDFLARISFPLYAVHCLFGFALLRYLADTGMPPWAALGFSLALIVGLAYAVHRGVELPSMRAGKALSQWLERRAAPARHAAVHGAPGCFGGKSNVSAAT